MSEWLSVMQTDEEPADESVYIRKLERLVRSQDRMLKKHRNFKHRYIRYLERLNRSLFAENTRLKKEIDSWSEALRVEMGFP